ncbi:MAG TPA: ribosomal protein S18-alanine N-acetyltransferase [Anaerolineales bacterium]|nr:ribosomal protein S18-alanine N-acetyltransferase [Anaerolineales bacterium]
MKLEDVPRVREIDVLSFTLPWPEKSYLFELIENPTTLAIVAEITPQDTRPVIIGMAVVWVVVDEAHIATIAIHPEYRGRGYGKKLLAEALRMAMRRGATLATLEVRENNLLAQQMYAKFGFNIVGRRPQYYKDNNEDAVLMTVDKLGVQFLDRLVKIGV